MNTKKITMTSPRKKNWVVKRDNKLRGAFGETDFDKKVIRINVKRHKSKSVAKIQKKSNGDEHLGKTIYHEELHRKNPKWTEKKVRKQEKIGWDKLTPKQKAKYYSKIKK